MNRGRWRDDRHRKAQVEKVGFSLTFSANCVFYFLMNGGWGWGGEDSMKTEREWGLP